MSVLEARAISIGFGGQLVLKDLSLTFEAGSITAIVGDNGAGKSTLLKVLSGAYQPDKGGVFLNGSPIGHTSPYGHRVAGIELVHQDLALAPHHDVVSNIFIAREIARRGFLQRTEMRRLAREKLYELGITIPDLGVKVGLLSGGQRQSIAIARALLFNPLVLLLDEPTAALAAKEVERFLGLIREERDRGRIIILVSHRLHDVLAVANRVVVLRQGAVAADFPNTTGLDVGSLVEVMVG
jgi:ABC-type sugar transport system ATPase subunit